MPQLLQNFWPCVCLDPQLPQNCARTPGLVDVSSATVVSVIVQGYKDANQDFPHQWTADQFFNEEQFEAYRELGYRLTKSILPEQEGVLLAYQVYVVSE